MSTKSIRVSRRKVTVAASAAMAIGGIFAISTSLPAQAQTMQQGDKVWVCKFVGKPYHSELLKGGKNPIEVGWQAADTDKDGNVNVGDEFADAQGQSVVVQINGDDPGVEACEAPVTPPTTTTSTTTGTVTTTTAPTTTTTPPTTGTTTTATVTTTAPPTTGTSTPSPTTTTTAPAGGAGGGTTPGTGAPETGGAGEGNPVNGLIGAGLLLGAAGLLTRETLKRRNGALTQD